VESAGRAVVSAWAQAARPAPTPSAKELAIAFRRDLQAQPELVGVRVLEDWIKRHYRLFCASLDVEWPPPYKDFLHELAEEMDPKRHDVRRKGKRRVTYMSYRVPDPNEAVVTLSEEMRKRA
jgi:hypothetical protein